MYKKKESQEVAAKVQLYCQRLLDNKFSVGTLEDLFVELSFINPATSKKYKNELTQFPNDFFRNKEIFSFFLWYFRNVVGSSEKFISQKRFRAFLALLYLKDFESERAVKMFCARRTFTSIEENIQPLLIAGEVYLSGNFKETFREADETFKKSDNLFFTIRELSDML